MKRMNLVLLTTLIICGISILININKGYAQSHVINGTTRVATAEQIIGKSEGINTPKRNGEADVIRYLGGTDTGRWVEYRIDVKKEGKYKVYPRLATPNNGWAFDLDIDGVKAASFMGKTTGGWGVWEAIEDQAQTISIKKGTHTLRLNFIHKKLNLDVLFFEYEGKSK